VTPRVTVVGTGTVGMATIRRIAEMDTVSLVSVVGRHAQAVHEVNDAFRAYSTSAQPEFFTSLETALQQTRPQALLVATCTALADVTPTIVTGLEHGTAVLCTSEELAFPDPSSLDTKHITEASRRAQRPVVAVGVNPGFVFDSLPIWLASARGPVRSMTISRIVDASVFGPRVQAGLGLGVNSEEFDAGVANGVIRGHVGFPESARILARHFGHSITRESETLTPILRTANDSHLRTAIESGKSVGVRQVARYWVSESPSPWLQFELTIHVDSLSAGLESQDDITIDDGEICRWTASPATGAISATSAQLVNLVQPALNMPAGLYTPVAVLGRSEAQVLA